MRMTMRRDRLALRGLYAVTPECPDTPRLAAMVQACVAGGAALVQYRAKHASGSLALVQARALAGICRAAGVPLIVNDSVELASAVGADGVHLGRDDVSVREARIALPGALIGVSCYADPERARAAGRDGADYVAIGSMYASATKPRATSAPLEAIAQARAASGLPVAAIGGITLDNAAAIVAAGADMLAVISALFDAGDAGLAATRFAQLFDPPTGATSDARTQPQPV
jgi:thiamine-phosphate pyrophosphorylase